MTVHYHDAQWGQSEIASLFSLMYNFTRKILIFLKAQHDRVRTTNKKSHTQNSFKIHF